MHKQVKTIRDIESWQGKRVLVRCDFNVPLNDQLAITDDSRIRESLPTLTYLLERGAKLVLMSHMGRPKNGYEAKYSLQPVARRLQELLPGTSVTALDEVVSPAVRAAAQSLQPGQILLLGNVRFDPREEKNDPALAQELASLGDIYVNDAFGSAHRAHASTEGITRFVPVSVAGLLMEKEIRALSGVLDNPERPLTAIIGGSKISTKITVLENLLDKVNTLVIGGGMLFTFLKAQGLPVGRSLVEDEYLETASRLLQRAGEKGVQILLARDVVAADNFDANADAITVGADKIPPDRLGLDIGPDSQADIQAVLTASGTVLWNGPLGVFEMPQFAIGTQVVADTIAELTEQGKLKSVLGGGDTVAAIELFGIPTERFTHVSTGGGASLEFIEGKELPGIAALDEAGSPVKV